MTATADPKPTRKKAERWTHGEIVELAKIGPEANPAFRQDVLNEGIRLVPGKSPEAIEAKLVEIKTIPPLEKMVIDPELQAMIDGMFSGIEEGGSPEAKRIVYAYIRKKIPVAKKGAPE